MLQLLSHGFDLAPIALLLNRLTLGAFYVLARFRFFYDPSKPSAQYKYDPVWGYDFGDSYVMRRLVAKSQRWLNTERHQSLTNKMKHCGFCRGARAWAWAAALIEVGGGLMLIAGLLSAFAALGLLTVTLFATRCTWRTKIYEQNPVDKLDCAACYLWRVEGLYIVMALIVILAGPGAGALT